MKLNNEIDLSINKSWYNRTKVQEDGITHIVDSKKYPLYQLNIAKCYFDIDSKEEIIDNIIQDLKSTIDQLQILKQKEEYTNQHAR